MAPAPIVTAMLHPDRARLLRGAEQRPGAAVANFYTWPQLAELLAGTNQPHEEVEAFVVEDAGIMVYRRTR